MSKNVTEYGKEIAEVLRGTPDSLRNLQGLMDLYKDMIINTLCPDTVEAFQERHRTASILIGCMQDKAEQIQADLERLEMVCDEMQETGE